MTLQNFTCFYNGTPGTVVYDASAEAVLGFHAAEEYGGWCTTLSRAELRTFDTREARVQAEADALADAWRALCQHAQRLPDAPAAWAQLRTCVAAMAEKLAHAEAGVPLAPSSTGLQLGLWVED